MVEQSQKQASPLWVKRLAFVVIGIFAILMAQSLVHVLSSAKLAAEHSRITKLTLATLDYCADNDDRFPPFTDSEDVIEAIKASQRKFRPGEEKTSFPNHTLADKDLDFGGRIPTWNSNLDGVKLDSLGKVSNLVMWSMPSQGYIIEGFVRRRSTIRTVDEFFSEDLAHRYVIPKHTGDK